MTTENKRQADRNRRSHKAQEAIAEARAERLRLLGNSIRVCRGDLTQGQLAELLSEVRDREILQTSVSRWELGTVDLSVEMVRDIETALGLQHGTILVAAGYMSNESIDMSALIRQDPNLHPTFRDDMEKVYRNYVKASKALQASEPKPPQKPRRSTAQR